MDDDSKRKEIGNRFIGGVGYEIGAGSLPSHYAGMRHATYLDKRSKRELEQHFKIEIPYDVHNVNEALDPADFLIAHHVIEHTPDPIGTIAQWASLIRDGGRMFFSLPAYDHACERDRPPTPFEHILDDYLFNRNADSFDSKQHIPHFINQWAAMDLKNIWYAELDVQQFVTVSLSEVRRNGHDLHWHTYSLDVMRDTVTAGFWFARHGLEIVHAEHCDGLLYIVGEKLAQPKEMPGFLRAHRDRLLRAADMLLLRDGQKHGR